MMIQLISEAESLAVGLSEVRDFLKISHNDEDAMIAGFIRAGAAACETFTGRKLIRQQWQITYNDWTEEVISIPLSPILSVDRIEVWIAEEFQEILPEKYLLDRASYQARILASPGDHWPAPERNIEGIKITVTAGFGTGQNDVPHDIRHGLLHWVAAAYEGGASENQAARIAENLWQPYRRVAV